MLGCCLPVAGGKLPDIKRIRIVIPVFWMWNQRQPDLPAADGRRRFERMDKSVAPALQLRGDDELVFGRPANQSVQGGQRPAQIAREVDFDLPQRCRDIMKRLFFLVGGRAGFDAADLNVIESMFHPQSVLAAAPIGRKDADVITAEGRLQLRRQRLEKSPFAGPRQRPRRRPHHQRRQRVIVAVVDDVSDVHVFIIAANDGGAEGAACLCYTACADGFGKTGITLRGSWELKQVSVRGYKKLSRLKPPAGYVCLIRDMDYGRYKIERMNHPAADLEDLTAALPFKTQIAYIAKTNDAAASERYLHQRYARHAARGEWFDLNDAQLREIRRLKSSRPRGGDRQEEADLGSEEPLPAYSAEQPPVSLKDLISNSYQASPRPARQSQATEEAAGKGCLYFFIGIIGLAALAAALGPNLMNSISPPPTLAKRPTSTSTRRPTATATRATMTMYVMTRANVRSCARTSCQILGGLTPGASIQSLRQVNGEKINGNNRWIRFSYQGRTAYIHSSLLSSARASASPTRRPTSTWTPTSTQTPSPTATDTDVPTATNTPPPTVTDTDVPTATDMPTSTATDAPTSTRRPTSTAASAVGMTMYVRTRGNAGANVRACPRTTCGIVGGLSPGADIQALERVEGEAVYGNSEWVQFEHNDTVAYVHSSLVSPNRPDN